MSTSGFVNKNLLSARIYMLLVCTLREKWSIQTITFTVKYHVNIQADENFYTKMHESEKRTKSDKNVHCVTRSLVLLLRTRYSSQGADLMLCSVLQVKPVVMLSVTIAASDFLKPNVFQTKIIKCLNQTQEVSIIMFH